MSNVVGGSRSSSDLFSASDSDDPLYETNVKPHDPIAKDILNTEEYGASQGKHVTTAMSRGADALGSVWDTNGAKNGDDHGASFGELSGANKRKRNPADDGKEPSSQQVLLRTSEDSTPTNGLGPANLAGRLETSSHESTVKRSRLTSKPSGFHQGNLVGNEVPNAPKMALSLPVEVWQHIFCYVPPMFLGRLLRVNSVFNSLLTHNVLTEASRNGKAVGAAEYRTAEAIWAASRRRFCPGLPRPLHGLNDLDMWKLLRGNDCQRCGQRKILLTSSTAPSLWESGPGENGVRVIWPFGVRCCGTCLRAHSEKEVTLLFSSTFPSFLLPALSVAFISQAGSYVASSTLRNANPPSEVQLTKHYYKPHIEQIKRQFLNARELGSASAEEWVKGLESEGRDKCSDAARWEQWEAKGGLIKVNSRPNLKAGSSALRQVSTAALATNLTLAIPSRNSSQPSVHGLPVNPVTLLAPPIVQTSSVAPSASLHSTPTAVHGSLPQRPQLPAPQTRPERNIRDVNESKAARRAEIERRCLALDPPLEPNVLYHMDSFQAALQISTALTDQAWEVLKPRLLAQRESAERREQERLQQGRMLQAKSEERKYQEAQLKEAKELLDKEWDTVQAPIRDRLATYADEIIHDSWADGNAVTKDTCAKFAADVLLYSRQRFYDNLAEDDKVTRAINGSVRSDSPNALPSRKLNLENMKWLFDNKVKNFTEQFQKELFLCNGCEGNFKFYGFEGVIQHYAAKHTMSLSLGSVVVHWRAEWPEHPPFHPNPSAAKAAYYAIPAPMSSSLPPQFSMAPQVTAAYVDYGQTAVHTAQPSQGYSTQFSSETYPPHFANQYQSSHYPPPTVPTHYPHRPEYQGQSPAFQTGSQFPPPSHEPPTGLVNGYGSYPDTQGKPTQSHPTVKVDNAYHYIPQPARYIEGHPILYTPSTYTGPQPSTLPPQSGPSNFAFVDSSHPTLLVAGGDLYQIQMNEMAKHARDVWFGTSGIKDIPQSVRIYVVIRHVVSRFEQKYTNEPSLAMFIDGLDHNALMRPVRSLNGLACKTCVTSGNVSGMGLHSHPQHLTTDRKLYTLPHLLNHFKSAHVEKARSTVDLQSGLEASRLDWKRDMVELPETSLIAGLVSAPGMDDNKLHLISSVFPGVFPSPLPTMGSLRNLGPFPKYSTGHNEAVAQSYSRGVPQESTQVSLYQTDVISRTEEIIQSRPDSIIQPPSRSSTRASEPPGDDEYDPNRPAYYGKIVESRQFVPAKLKYTNHVSSPDPHSSFKDVHTSHRLDRDGRIVKQSAEHTLTDLKSLSEGPYGNQMSRHTHQRGGFHTVNYNPERDNISSDTSKLEQPHMSKDAVDQNRYMSEDGEVDEDLLPGGSIRRSDSHVAESAAAERFLNEFNPGAELERGEREHSMSEQHIRSRPWKQDVADGTVELRSEFSERPVNSKRRRQDELAVERSLRSTPSLTERVESRNEKNMRYSQLVNGHARPYDVEARSTSHMRYYDEEGYNAGGLSPQSYEVRSASVVDYNVPGSVQRIVEMPRIVRNAGHWPRTVHRSRSRSPVQLSRGIEHYRVRSPQQPPRPSAVYHVSPSAVQPDMHPQPTIRYVHGADQVQYAGPRTQAYPHEQYQQRVEYIPSRGGSYGYQDERRYIVAPPTEHRRATDIHLPRGYAGEPVYEMDGQLYCAEPRQADPRSIRAIHPGYVECRDEYR